MEGQALKQIKRWTPMSLMLLPRAPRVTPSLRPTMPHPLESVVKMSPVVMAVAVR